MSSAPTSLKSLQSFKFTRLLNEDPTSHSLTLLGTFPAPKLSSPGSQPAIVRIEKTAFDKEAGVQLASVLVHAKPIESTDIYTWLFGWLGSDDDRPDVKINIIFPATEAHIRKYTKQEFIMVHETPQIYRDIVKPYIFSFPPERTQWVEDIMSGKSEVEKVLYASPDFLILPDMKWDLRTLSALYLIAIVRNYTIQSLRDLRKSHLPLLREIRLQATRIVREKWGIEEGGVRMFIHYQPSYYRFHVHISHTSQTGFMGMTVGQAHLLDDVISLLELDPDAGPGIFERLTLTYGLGDQHGLFEVMKAAQSQGG